MPIRFYLRATHSIFHSTFPFYRVSFFLCLYDKNFVGMFHNSTKASLLIDGPVGSSHKTSPRHFGKGAGGEVYRGRQFWGPSSWGLGLGLLCRSEPLLSSLLRRMPQLETLEIMKLVNCPETFTPDMRYIMGESPSVRGYFILVGMNCRPFIWWRSWKASPSHSDWACWASSFLVHMVCDVLSPARS